MANFTVYEQHFTLLEKIINDLELAKKPEHIFNCDKSMVAILFYAILCYFMLFYVFIDQLFIPKTKHMRSKTFDFGWSWLPFGHKHYSTLQS